MAPPCEQFQWKARNIILPNALLFKTHDWSQIIWYTLKPERKREKHVYQLIVKP